MFPEKNILVGNSGRSSRRWPVENEIVIMHRKATTIRFFGRCETPPRSAKLKTEFFMKAQFHRPIKLIMDGSIIKMEVVLLPAARLPGARTAVL